MTLWLDSKMDKYVLAYFKKALTYEIGVSHVDKMLIFDTEVDTDEASSVTVSEFKLTGPQVNSAIKNLDRLLDLPVIDVDSIISVATSNAKLFADDESKNVVTLIVTKAYENLRDIWKLQSVFEGFSIAVGWKTVPLILNFDRKMNDINKNLEQFDGTDIPEFYKNVGDVRDNAWSKVSDDASSVFVLDDARYLATRQSMIKIPID